MLSRPLDQRIREHKYRCAQSLVFGLPVIALQYFGHKLGGPESARWITAMQIVLTGWILFVAATGMISEGVMLLVSRRKLSGDFLVALIGTALFVVSCFGARLFDVVVIVVATWTAMRWFSLARRRDRAHNESFANTAR